MHKQLDQSASGRLSHVDNSVPLRMPASGADQPAESVEGGVIANPPKNHSGKHAFIYLDQHLLHQPPPASVSII